MDAVQDQAVAEVAEPKNSTHRVEVVPVQLRKHDGADTLSVVDVDGYSCVVKTESWQGKSKAFYVPPDNLVPIANPLFSFLAEKANQQGMARIKAQKIRGVISFGLLVPAPDDAVVGEDWAERLGVQHYDPVVSKHFASHHGGLKMGGEVAAAPAVPHVKYDLEAGRRYAKVLFRPGETVAVTEKIHGANGRFVFSGGQMHCGSRTEWKKEYPSYDHLTVEWLTERMGDPVKAQETYDNLRSRKPRKNLWWQALDATPALRAFCESHPDVVVYGEVYGAVQDLNYGKKPGEVAVAVFDLMTGGEWMDFGPAYDLAQEHGLPWAPLVAHPVPFDFDQVCSLAEGPSLVPGAGHIREGVVVRPQQERRDHRLGRVCLKWVSGAYLERSK